MNIFERATRLKLRFESGKGLISIEELWQLSLEDLDAIAKKVNKKLKDEGEESFITTKTPRNTTLELELSVLKHIIKTKIDERDHAKLRAEKKTEAEFLKGLLLEKKTDQLKGLTPKQIENRIKQLENEGA